MDQSLLSSRAIMGMYFARLESDKSGLWLPAVSNLFNSDQGSETYAFLGQSPAMREWIGGRQAKGFNGNGITVINKHYEATLEIAVRDARRDKTAQIQARVAEFADRGVTHWGSLVSDLILAGDSTACYDGQYFFDTDHSEGDSGQQSNKITVTLSGLPVVTAGTATAPSMESMQQCILRAISTMLAFKDDRGEPMNEGATDFAVMVPASLYPAALAAVSSFSTAALPNNFNPNLLGQFNVSVLMNTRLSSWTTKFAVFRTDSPVKAIIRQTEQDTQLKAKAEGSEFEFDNDAWQFGIDAWRGVGYGYWQRAVQVTMA